jgi:hypothetical protein
MCGLGEWPPFHSLPSPPHPFPSLLLSHLASNCTHNPDIDLWDAGFAVVASLPPAPGSADGPHGAGLGWRQASSNALLLLMAEAPEAGSTCDVKRDLVQCQKRPSTVSKGAGSWQHLRLCALGRQFAGASPGGNKLQGSGECAECAGAASRGRQGAGAFQQ